MINIVYDVTINSLTISYFSNHKFILKGFQGSACQVPLVLLKLLNVQHDKMIIVLITDNRSD